MKTVSKEKYRAFVRGLDEPKITEGTTINVAQHVKDGRVVAQAVYLQAVAPGLPATVQYIIEENEL